LNAETIFATANLMAVAGWLLLIVAPRNRWATQTAGTIIPITLAAVYLVLLAINWGGSRGGFSSLQDVAELFSNPWLLLAGWVHYLAFDLFVGTWEVRDSFENGLPRLLVVPCLLLTFLFGPLGFLAYHVTRRFTAVSARACTLPDGT
jgi:hypothetical protein